MGADAREYSEHTSSLGVALGTKPAMASVGTRVGAKPNDVHGERWLPEVENHAGGITSCVRDGELNRLRWVTTRSVGPSPARRPTRLVAPSPASPPALGVVDLVKCHNA
jgi:hypothetical protein